jgi:hypothetical protein
MGYQLAVPIIFLYLLIRVWALHSRRIALVFLGLFILATFGIPMLQPPALVPQLTLIGLAVTLYFIDRYKSSTRLTD